MIEDDTFEFKKYVGTYACSLEDKKKLENKILKFELICILHGINNIGYYQSFTLNELIAYVKMLQKDGIVQMPSVLTNHFNKNEIEKIIPLPNH